MKIRGLFNSEKVLPYERPLTLSHDRAFNYWTEVPDLNVRTIRVPRGHLGTTGCAQHNSSECKLDSSPDSVWCREGGSNPHEG